MDLNETKDSTTKGSKRAWLALVFAFLLALAGVVAYLTATDSVTNLFSFADEDKDVTVEWREVPPTIDVNHDGSFLVVRIAWNNTTAKYVEGSTTTTLNAYSVGNEGSYDAPDPYIFLADTQTEEYYQALLIGAEVSVTNSVVPVPTGNLFYIEKDRGSTEHPTKNGVTYSKYRMTVKPYTTTVIKESQLKKLLSVQPVEPQWSGYVHNGWTTPVKVGTDPDTGNDKYVVKSTWVKRSNPDVTEDSSYAAVYGDDTLVFGRGAAPGSYEGKPLSSQNGVACTWYDIEDAVYSRVELPWRDMKPNIKSVVVKDTIAPKSIAFWFETMGNLASVDLSKLDASRVEDAQSLFGNDALISTIDLSMLDMPKVKNISNMFYGCKGATSLKIPGGFTNELKEMGQVFYDCISVKELNLEGLDVSGVTNMGRLFWNCPTLTTVFVDENWDVQHIRDGIAEGIYDDHGQMFSGCTNLVGGNGTKCENRLGQEIEKASIKYANIDQSGQEGYLTCRTAHTGTVTLSGKAILGSTIGIRTSNLPVEATLSYQWYRDDSPISGATSSSYSITDKDLEHSIRCCLTINGEYSISSNSLTVSSPSIALSTYPGYFGTSISSKISNISSDATISYQWYRDDSPISGAIDSSYYIDNEDLGHSITCKVVINDAYVFFSEGIEASADKFNKIAFAVYSADDQSLNFYKRYKVPQSGESFNGKTVTNVYTRIEDDNTEGSIRSVGWQYGASSPRTKIESVSVIDEGITPKSTAWWFYQFWNCKNFNLSKLDTSETTSMSGMFCSCFRTTALDLSSFDTSNVTNMSEMFNGLGGYCGSTIDTELTNVVPVLNISSFDTKAVTDMSGMFDGCRFKALDLSHFDTSNVTDMSRMFSSSEYALTALNLSSFDTSKVTDMNGMFKCCYSLPTLDLGSFDTKAVTDMSGMFDQCFALKTIFVSTSWSTTALKTGEDMFFACNVLTGSQGTKYKDGLYIHGPERAHVDGGTSNPGYLTLSSKRALAGSAAITGTTTVGSTLSASLTDSNASGTLVYQWYRNGKIIKDATGSSYKLSEADKAAEIQCKVRASNCYGSLISPKVGPVVSVLKGSIKVSGEPIVGETLTAIGSETSPDAELAYQWLRDSSPIDGATSSSYALTEADINHKIKCVVTASGFSGSLTSNEIGPVTKPKTEVEKQLESMTLHEKVCQMFCVYPEDLGGSGALTVAGSTQQKTLQSYPYGGVCYFLQNIKNETQAKTLVSTLESYSEIPLFHAVDEEGGRVQRIGGTTYSGAVRGAGIGNQLNAMYTYKNQGTDTAYNNAQLLAANLNRLGMNWDFAPCADVNSNPSNPVIGDRAYGDDFDATGELVASAVRGFNDAGVATSLKHFPGHGDTATDSHTGAAAVSKTLDQLRNEEFKSFKAGIAAGADSVMMGHLMIEGAKESVPTSCSYEFVTEVLRNELGFDGVITTDGMGMGALTKVFGTTKQGHIDAVMACLKAGIDVFLLPGDPAACVDAIEAAVASGEISEDRIDASVKRILTLKEKIAANASKRNAATLQAMYAAAVADEELIAAATQSSPEEEKETIEENPKDEQGETSNETPDLQVIAGGLAETDDEAYRRAA